MPRTPVACAVCQQVDRPGSYRQRRDVLICTSCQADAKQLIEIQDSIWPGAGDAGPSSDDAGLSTPAPTRSE